VESLSGGTFSPGGRAFEPVKSETGGIHHSENDNEATLSFRVVNLPGYLEGFRELEETNVNIQDESGQSWIMPDAFVTSVPSVSNGEITVEMASGPAQSI
jgi:hypothetical protein